MRHLGIFLIFVATFFIGCGGGGSDTSSAGGEGIVKATGTPGQNGANYTLSDSLKVSWKHPIADARVELSDFVLTVDNVKYPTNYIVEKSIPVNQQTGFAEPGSTAVPYTFILTLPYSDKERIGTLSMNYKIGKKSKSVAVQVNLSPLSNPDKNTITPIDASTEATFDSQELHYIGQVKNGDKPQAGALIAYSVQTSSYVYGSVSKGTVTADESGTFELKIKSSINQAEKPRDIIVIFRYKDITQTWKVAQAGYPELSFEETYADKTVPAGGGDVKYLGKIVNAASQTIECTVNPSSTATISNTPVKTDAYGNFTVNLKVNPYTDTNASDRTIDVIMRHKNASTTWTLTQAAPTS